MRYPDYYERAQEPPRDQPTAEQEPQDPSLSEHITCLLARQSWIPPTLPLNTPAVTKDVYEFMTEDQQVAREKYVSLLASNLYTADMLSALAPNTAAVAIKIPLRNLSQLLSWPACLNAMRVTEAADSNFSLEKFRTTMLVVVLRPVAQFFTRHLQALKELNAVKEHHASLLMLVDLPFWEAVLLDATQHFQNTAFGRARLAHVYTIGEGHDQCIDRLYVHLPPIAGIVLLRSLLREQQGEGEIWQAQAFKLEWKPTSEEKSLPARLSGKMRVIHTLAPHLERATMEAVHKSLDVSHVWITKFVKLPTDTVGSFIMTFNTDAVADLLGVEEANATDRPQNERGPEGVSSSQADIQPSEPSLPTSHLPTVYRRGLPQGQTQQ